MTNWPWPLNGVQSFFDNLWNAVIKTPYEAVQAVSGWIWNAGGWIVNTISSAIQSVSGWIWNAANWLAGQISNITTWLANALASIPGMVVSAIQGAMGWLSSAISGIVGSIQGVLSGWGNWLTGAIGAIPGAILGPIQGTLNWLANSLGGAISGAVGQIGNLFSQTQVGIISGLPGALQLFASGFFAALPGLGLTIAQQLSPSFASQSFGYLSGFQGWVGERASNIIRSALDSITKPIGTPGPEAIAEAMRRVDYITKAIVGLETLTITAEMLLPTKYVGFGGSAGAAIAEVLLAGVGGGIMGSMMRPTILRPLEYALNEWLVPLQPEADDLIKLWTEGIIDHDTYLKYMRRVGLGWGWPDQLAEAAYRHPGFTELREMYWRGLISEETLRWGLRRQAIEPTYLDAYVGLIENIPSPSDLIRFVVREVITPEEFYEWMKKQGYKEWAYNAYWEAHWVLPPPERLFAAYLRGIISYDEYKKYIVWHDYKPEPRPGISKSDMDIMYGTQFELPGRIDSRWMYEWGVITREEFRELQRQRGIDPKWLDKLVAGIERNLMREEIGGLITEAITDRASGWIDDSTFRRRLEALGLPRDRIEYYLAKAQAKAERELREEEKKLAITAFQKGVITEDQLRRELLDLGLLPSFVENLVALEKLRKVRAGGGAA